VSGVRRTSKGGGVAALADRLERAQSTVDRAVREEVRAELELLVEEQFAGQHGPNGERWTPRVPPTGGWPILRRTGRMRASTRITETSRGFLVTMASPAGYHQRGTSKMVARQIFPGGEDSNWQARIDAAIRRGTARAFKRAA
jgi:hypothetical protein